MSDAVLLQVEGITKVFPGTIALQNVQLMVNKGEIHALCGENGAGKSTLMNVIGGVFPPSSGTIYFDGCEIIPRNPKEAQEIGIGFVHQELSLCPHLTAAENIFMGRLPRKNGLIDYKKLFADADEVLAQFCANFSSKNIVSGLTVSEQQLVEIAKSVSLNCKLLIFDEPTSSLTDKETLHLFEIIKKLRQQGLGILYISHRMGEIFELCDRVSVFKDGHYVTTMNIQDITSDDIISAMVGRELGALYPPKCSHVNDKDILLEVRNFSGAKYHDISFSLRRGEILSFAGLIGAGRSELMRGLCGIDPVRGGIVCMNGSTNRFHSYRDAIDHGLVYLTEDRKLSGLFSGMSIRRNMSSANPTGVSRGMWLNDELECALADRYVKELSIKIPGLNYPISCLSGGNQQKCLVGKWLSTSPKIIIMDEPTRGIDVGAKVEIHHLLRNLANSGVGVIVISSELPEVIGIGDRVAVMHEGSLSAILELPELITEENILKLASGVNLGGVEQ